MADGVTILIPTALRQFAGGQGAGATRGRDGR